MFHIPLKPGRHTKAELSQDMKDMFVNNLKYSNDLFIFHWLLDPNLNTTVAIRIQSLNLQVASCEQHIHLFFPFRWLYRLGLLLSDILKIFMYLFYLLPTFKLLLYHLYKPSCWNLSFILFNEFDLLILFSLVKHWRTFKTI